MLMEWGITNEKIHCFIRDSGSNMIRAMRFAAIPDVNCTSLLNEYQREKRISISNDPLLWWKVNKKFQSFNLIVRQYLSSPPNSVASEQLFSGAGLIYNPLRNRLDGDKAANLLFIKYNLFLLESLHFI
ncbi:unnamed protein product [Parnassius mnemosyne]|uniref:HAT C-terminal dimerisation domain-containing protein n=1 Tax=Parnassius mnemosyne TaxID=213953 RepID=A0AAV1LLI2_9NEOP